MARDKAYRQAERRIEQARRSGAKELDLMDMNLTELPESLGELTQLLRLHIGYNELVALPESLGELTQLRSLDLGSNQLTALPKSLGQLMRLEYLSLSNNRLTTLPVGMSKLAKLSVLEMYSNHLSVLPEVINSLRALKTLDVDGNYLDSLPEWLGNLNLEILDIGGLCGGNPLNELSPCLRKLHALKTLRASTCRLTDVPSWLCELTQLEIIWLNGNQLVSLPSSLADLRHLSQLKLGENPLNPALAAANEEGLNAVKRYLREMGKGARKRFEAKLLILGDGNEGKTCVSRALRGLPFRKQNSTRGVDVMQWKFSHPDGEKNPEKEITLNIWDFEGQEISHQTHQFFLSSQSLYLIVFKCRDQFLIERAEYWLDTIRARAPKAKVVIVISHCEERSPHIPLDRIKAQYGDLLAEEWFFAVGCENGKNLEYLRLFLKRSAAYLEFMGSPWPISYEKAELDVKAKAKSNSAYITRMKLHGILRKAGVNEESFDDAAAALARLGVLTQFPDCSDLRDFLVLKPQWLTKAISKVMEDTQLSDDKGEIALRRMEGIWNKARMGGMFATFHNCMKEFELCYDLEDIADSCLVPLRFGFVPPTIPWSNMPEFKERRMEFKLNIRPPMGIMSRFIVKTHHMIARTPEHPKGIYWHNGVFLRTNSPRPSEALCEFIPEDRLFRVRVRAAFPQNLSEQIYGYLQAVFSFFGGLSAERSYGCIQLDSETGVERQCKGLHTEKRIYTAISKSRDVIDCEFEEHEIDPRILVGGFPSFSDFVTERFTAVVRREIDKEPEWAAPFLRRIGSLVEWAEGNSEKLDQVLKGQVSLADEFKQEAELKLQEYLGFVSVMLDDREFTSAPGLISIMSKERSPWNPVGFFKKTYTLTPFCECEGNIHACEDGSVDFTKDKAWWVKSAPWVARSTKLLAAGLQLAFAGMPLALGADTAKGIEDQVKLMAALTKYLDLEMPKEESEDGPKEILGGAVGKDLRRCDHETALMRAALTKLLEETAPMNYRAKRWGSLSRHRMRDNTHRWLCDTCAAKYR